MFYHDWFLFVALLGQRAWVGLTWFKVWFHWVSFTVMTRFTSQCKLAHHEAVTARPHQSGWQAVKQQHSGICRQVSRWTVQSELQHNIIRNYTLSVKTHTCWNSFTTTLNKMWTKVILPPTPAPPVLFSFHSPFLANNEFINTEADVFSTMVKKKKILHRDQGAHKRVNITSY